MENNDRVGIVGQVVEAIKRGKVGIDYMDIRLGESVGTVVSLRKKEVEDVSYPRSFGGSVRVVNKGGWGFAAFSRIEQLPEAAERAKRYARLVAREKTQLADVPVVEDTVKASIEEKDFLEVSLGEKVKLMQEYDRVAWSVGGEVVNVDISYNDALAWKLFVSSEGSVISQEKALTYAWAQVTARKGDVVQRYFENLTDTNFKAVRGREEQVRLAALKAVELTQAGQVKSGSYKVILDPVLAGVFAHEAFGHLSEADNVYENPQLARVMRLGKQFGSDLLTIYDDPSRLRLRGSFKYDEEGVASARVMLLDKGKLVGRLHSRETAGKMREIPNGHARAAGPRSMPIVRMGVTCIAAEKSSLNEMLSGVRDGLYCVNWQAGNTDHERFTFTAGYAQEIKSGTLGRVLRDVKLTGNLFETMKNVDMVGKDVTIKGGSCGKMGQYVPENSSAPAIGISKVEVIGV